MKACLLAVVLAITCHNSLGVNLPSPFVSLANEQVDVKVCQHKEPTEGWLDCLGANSEDGLANLKMAINGCGRIHADSREHVAKFIQDLCKGDKESRGHILQDLDSCLGWLQGQQGNPPQKEPVFSTAKKAQKCVSALYKTVDRESGKEVN